MNATVDTAASMTHREVLEAMSGLLLAMFVAMLSSTVVSNALPVIVADLHGTESGYTWVMVSTLLALTASRTSVRSGARLPPMTVEFQGNLFDTAPAATLGSLRAAVRTP